MDKKSMLIHYDIIDRYITLNDKQFGELVRAMIAYSKDGTEPKFKSPIMQLAFNNERPRIQEENKKYIEKCLKNQENGKLGGRPKKTENNRTDTEKTERFSKKPKKPDTDTDTDTETDTDIYNTRARENKPVFHVDNVDNFLARELKVLRG